MHVILKVIENMEIYMDDLNENHLSRNYLGFLGAIPKTESKRLFPLSVI